MTISGSSGSEIHYTVDGSTPTAESPVYSEPLTFTETTTLKADVRQKDMDLSKDYVTEWRTYIAEPLQREVGELRAEVAQLRHAIQQVGECDYRAECPVLRQLQHESPSD